MRSALVESASVDGAGGQPVRLRASRAVRTQSLVPVPALNRAPANRARRRRDRRSRRPELPRNPAWRPDQRLLQWSEADPHPALCRIGLYFVDWQRLSFSPPPGEARLERSSSGLRRPVCLHRVRVRSGHRGRDGQSAPQRAAGALFALLGSCCSTCSSRSCSWDPSRPSGRRQAAGGRRARSPVRGQGGSSRGIGGLLFGTSPRSRWSRRGISPGDGKAINLNQTPAQAAASMNCTLAVPPSRSARRAWRRRGSSATAARWPIPPGGSSRPRSSATAPWVTTPRRHPGTSPPCAPRLPHRPGILRHH